VRVLIWFLIGVAIGTIIRGLLDHEWSIIAAGALALLILAAGEYARDRRNQAQEHPPSTASH
jgi:membrane protein DedA with SNARE-associated domain